MWRHLAASSCAVPGSARSAATARPADLGSHSSAAGKRTWLFAKLQPHRQWGRSHLGQTLRDSASSTVQSVLNDGGCGDFV